MMSALTSFAFGCAMIIAITIVMTCVMATIAWFNPPRPHMLWFTLGVAASGVVIAIVALALAERFIK
jgi:hypothetical protein